MAYSTVPTIGAIWEQGGRTAILRWLTALQQTCVATVDEDVDPDDFMTVAFPQGRFAACESLLVTKPSGKLYVSFGVESPWVLLYDPSASGQSPPGLVVWWSGAADSIPENYLIADGRTVSRSTYNELFSAIGVIFGAGDGSTTFQLPDLRYRAAIGANNSDMPGGVNTSFATANAGDVGGAETHTLTIDEMNPHSHAITIDPDSPTTKFDDGTDATPVRQQSARPTAYTGYAGQDQPHTNMQPSLALIPLIRYRT